MDGSMDRRLVAYVLRKTLGWLDDNGEPINQDISVSYCELIAEAGISRAGTLRRPLQDRRRSRHPHPYYSHGRRSLTLPMLRSTRPWNAHC